MEANGTDHELEVTLEQDAESQFFHAFHHIIIVRQDSPEAAALIEQILELRGVPAVMRITFILAVLKLEVLQKRQVPDLRSYAFMLQDYEDIKSLFEQVIDHCLKSWGLHNDQVDLTSGNYVMKTAVM